jgi:polysaccharide pyruvyl transferase WcaK-like protein
VNVATSGRKGDRPRIGIWGHFHGGNQGDDLIVHALVRNIRALCPEADFVAFSQDPADTRRRHGLPAHALSRAIEDRMEECGGRDAPAPASAPHPAVPSPARDTFRRRARDRVETALAHVPAVRDPLRRLVHAGREGLRVAREVAREPPFLLRSYRRLRDVDVLVVAGSGTFMDAWHGPWGHPLDLCKWALLARVTRTRWAVLSVGAGPVSDNALSRALLRTALRLADYRSFRDVSSARIAADVGLREASPIYPDLAFSADLDAVVGPRPPAPRLPGRLVVGVNPMAHRDPRYIPSGDGAAYGRYIDKVAAFVAWLIERDCTVVLLYSQLRADPRACADVRARLAAREHLDLERHLVERPIGGLADLVDLMALCDVVVAARFHCVLIPYLLAKPVIGLAYHPKTRDLMISMGQGDYCVDIDDFAPADLAARFERLEDAGERARLVAEITRRTPEQRRALDDQYRTLLALLGQPLRGSVACREKRRALNLPRML